jgi:hypothetical protein
MTILQIEATQEKRTALFWVIMQRVVVTSYQRFGTTYRSHLQGSRIKFKKKDGKDRAVLIYFAVEAKNQT